MKRTRVVDHQGSLKKRWSSRVTFMVLLLVLFLPALPARAAEMVTNGNFNTAASWSFDAPGGNATGQTNAYDGTVTRTAGSGSAKAYIPTNNRAKTVIGVVRQTVSIPSGSTVSAASLWAMLSADRNTGDSVTIDLRYADMTTVNLLNSGELTNTIWSQFTAAPALTLAQNVDQIILTLNAKTANNTTNDVALWVDEISITYTPPVIDALSVGSNTAVATTATPLATDVQMQVLQVGCSNTGDSNCAISSVTVDDIGTVAAGDIANLKIHIDADNDFGNGVLGTVTQAGWAGTSTVVDLSSLGAAIRTVTFGTPKYIRITYDLAASADTKSIQSRVTAIAVTSPDTGASGTWDSNSITVTSGPGNTLATCADCHDMPPADSADAIRNAPVEGEVRGDHAKHNAYGCAVCHVAPATETSADFVHRDANINMKNAAIGVSDNGTYSRGATFAQSNTPITGTCSNVNCHGNTVTPQWGVGATTCSSCHQLPPATGAHASHYTAKGWATGNATNCSQCHPDNSSVHSNVTDGVIGINAGLNYAGGSCSGAGIGLGCHNEYATPVWSTGNAVCTSCHTAGGGQAGDPVSGLHAVTPSVSGQKHDQSVTGGCTACHSGALTGHWNGTFTGNGSIAGDRTAMGLAAFYTNSGADNTGTCSTTACHLGQSDGWAHKWNSTANYYTTAATACLGCHGDLSGFNAGVDHLNTAGMASMHQGTGTYKCQECHGMERAVYPFTFGTADWASLNAGNKHGNGLITMNDDAGGTYTGWQRGTGGNSTKSACLKCHTNWTDSAPQHWFTNTTWTPEEVAGGSIAVACGSCHTGGVTTSAASGAHTLHNSGTAALVAPGTPCQECHGNNGGLGFNNALAGTHGTGGVDFASVTYSTAVRNNVTGTCLTANCHNRNTGTDQSTAWNSTALACDDCHYYAAAPTSAGNTAHARPLSTSHNDHFARGKTCAQCHGADPAAGDTSHINGGTAALADRAVALQDEAALAWTAAAAVTDYTFNDADNTCYSPTNNGLGCHATAGAAGAADGTRPDWDVAFASTACTACHTNTTTAAVNPTSGLHGVVPSVSGVQHDDAFGAGGTCASCHPTVSAQANHMNGTFTDNGSIAGDRTAMGLASFYTSSGADNSGTCATTSCHLSFSDGWAHVWNSTAGYYTTNTTACEGCHGDMSSGFNAGVDHRSRGPHTGGTTYGCADCHVLEASTNTYTFTWSTNDWGGTSKHGNSTIEVNTQGTYNTTSNRCTACHTTSDGVHNFVDTGWAVANLAGDAISAGHGVGADCKGCHAATQGIRRGIQGEFPATLQHGAAWASMTSADCEKCHVETNGPDGTVQLKVWNADGATFATANYDKTNLSTANTHCISCHDTTRNVTVAGLSPPARSMANYTLTTTYNNHNFTTTTGAVVPQKAKAVSPHGNPAGNQLKATESSVTTAMGCLHCHPSHGSAYGSQTAAADATGAAMATSRMLGGNPSALAGIGYDYTSEGTLTDPALCWGCHDNKGVADYYGDTTTGHWNGGTWKNPTFSYKTGKGGVSILHIANKVDGGVADNAAANIVCTTCHDVHGSPTVAQFYSPALKGKWLTSPYYEDRAPPSRTAGTNGLYSWPNANSAARSAADALSPRAAVISGTAWAPKEVGGGYGIVGTQNGAWGYFIDANTFGMSAYQPYASGAVTQKYMSNYDATAANISTFGGLCMTACHSVANIEARTTWTGHKPVVPGFGGTDAASDLFNVNGTTYPAGVSRNQMVGQGWYNNADWGQNLFASGNYGERQGGDAGTLDARTYSHNKAASWGVNPTTAGAQAGYHQFPCSKCHTPHASELPALMRSNCLDTKHSAYEWRMAAEANNCHRVEDSGAAYQGAGDPYNGTTNGKLWNTVTPW